MILNFLCPWSPSVLLSPWSPSSRFLVCSAAVWACAMRQGRSPSRAPTCPQSLQRGSNPASMFPSQQLPSSLWEPRPSSLPLREFPPGSGIGRAGRGAGTLPLEFGSLRAKPSDWDCLRSSAGERKPQRCGEKSQGQAHPLPSPPPFLWNHRCLPIFLPIFIIR